MDPWKAAASSPAAWEEEASGELIGDSVPLPSCAGVSSRDLLGTALLNAVHWAHCLQISLKQMPALECQVSVFSFYCLFVLKDREVSPWLVHSIDA